MPPFKGNDTGGIIAYSMAAQADIRILAVEHCARYGKVVKLLSVQPYDGGYISFACRWVPYGSDNGRCAPCTEPVSLAPWVVDLPGDMPGARRMRRQHFTIGLAACLLARAQAADAGAVELPLRKAGLWEMKVIRTGAPLPEMTMQHCTDETTDKEMSNSSRRRPRKSAPSRTSGRRRAATPPIPSAASPACR